MRSVLFNDGDLYSVLEQKRREMRADVERQPEDYILNVSEDDFCASLVSQFTLEPPALREEDRYQQPPMPAKIDVSRDPSRSAFGHRGPVYADGTRITLVYPFDGDGEFFRYRPSSWPSVLPEATVNGQELRITLDTLDDNATTLGIALQQTVDHITRYLGTMQHDIDAYNASLPQVARQLVEERKRLILRRRGLAVALNIPIRRRDADSGVAVIPPVQKKIRIARPSVPATPFAPEWTLAEPEYEDILTTLHHMTLVMERNPRTFAQLHEEQIRDHFLMYLNGNYQGQATGETFNSSGKTDILIRYEGKNVFIAECKVWKGQKKYTDAIDQLIGYTSWRDTKTAILVFHKGSNPTSVVETVASVMTQHANCKRQHQLADAALRDDTTRSYVFHQPSDRNRELILTTMVFNIPLLEQEAGIDQVA